MASAHHKPSSAETSASAYHPARRIGPAVSSLIVWCS